MSETVGAFLKSKAGNMARWLQSEGNIVTVELDKLTPLQLTAFAQELRRRHLKTIEARDFAGLLGDKDTPAQLLMIVSYVERNPRLHDKFWRYMALFSDTVSDA